MVQKKNKSRKTVKALPARKLTAESAKAVRGGKHLAGVKYEDTTVSSPPTKPS